MTKRQPKRRLLPRAEVTVFTTTASKIQDAKRMGAREAILGNDEAAFARLANHFDLIISTVPQAYPMQRFVNLLKLDAKHSLDP